MPGACQYLFFVMFLLMSLDSRFILQGMFKQVDRRLEKTPLSLRIRAGGQSFNLPLYKNVRVGTLRALIARQMGWKKNQAMSFKLNDVPLPSDASATTFLYTLGLNDGGEVLVSIPNEANTVAGPSSVWQTSSGKPRGDTWTGRAACGRQRRWCRSERRSGMLRPKEAPRSRSQTRPRVSRHALLMRRPPGRTRRSGH